MDHFRTQTWRFGAELEELKLKLQGQRHLQASHLRNQGPLQDAHSHACRRYRGMIGSGSSKAIAFPEHVLQNPSARSHRHVFGCDAKLP